MSDFDNDDLIDAVGYHILYSIKTPVTAEYEYDIRQRNIKFHLTVEFSTELFYGNTDNPDSVPSLVKQLADRNLKANGLIDRTARAFILNRELGQRLLDIDPDLYRQLKEWFNNPSMSKPPEGMLPRKNTEDDQSFTTSNGRRIRLRKKKD